MKNVLVIAGVNERYYYEAFVTPCRSKGIRLCILDPLQLHRDAMICIAMEENGLVAGYVDTLELVDDVFKPYRLSLTEISAAWYLREDSSRRSGTSTLAVRFTSNEVRGTIYSLMSVLGCPWVNALVAIDKVTSNKLYQQQIAAHVGLSIPRTVLTNDPLPVVSLAKQQEELLLKTIGYIQLDEMRNLCIYSERYSHNELAEAGQSIRCCPVFAQQYITKRYEHRVMVMGPNVLACRIDSQASDKTKTDWRHYDFEHVAHTAATLPQDIQDKLRAFMAHIDLVYGAVDLIERPDGEYVFLEVNPSGQWGWIADLAGLPIAEGVADMLEKVCADEH